MGLVFKGLDGETYLRGFSEYAVLHVNFMDLDGHKYNKSMESCIQLLCRRRHKLEIDYDKTDTSSSEYKEFMSKIMGEVFK